MLYVHIHIDLVTEGGGCKSNSFSLRGPFLNAKGPFFKGVRGRICNSFSLRGPFLNAKRSFFVHIHDFFCC